jgi:uncharacterized protein YkwD
MPVIPEISNSAGLVLPSTPPSPQPLRPTRTPRSLANVSNLAFSSHNSHSDEDNDDDHDGSTAAQSKKTSSKNNNSMRKSMSRIRTMIRSSSRKLASSRSSAGGDSNNNSPNSNNIIHSKREYNGTESKQTRSEASCNSDKAHYNELEAVSSHVVKTQQPLTLLSTNRSILCDQQRLLDEAKEASRIMHSANDSSVHENDQEDDNTEDDTYIHVMVNRERLSRGLSTLKPSRFLTMLARAHAQVLADRTKLGHSVQTLEDLQHTLNSLDVGENIQRGHSVQEMHAMSVKDGTFNCMNILRESYLEFGMGTAKSRNDGKLYMVQLFRGRLESGNRNNDMQRRQYLDDGNRSSSIAIALGQQAKDKKGKENQHLVDAAAAGDSGMDRLFLCSFCW